MRLMDKKKLDPVTLSVLGLIFPILTDDLEPCAIQTRVIKNLAVTTAKINDLAVTTAKILDLAVTTAKINDLAVTNAKIGNLAVDTAQIANLAVTTGKIALLAVDTAQIAALAVTAAKIDALAVTTAKIDNLAVTDAKINDCAIGKLTAGNLSVIGTLVSGGKFVTGVAGTNRIEITPTLIVGYDSSNVAQFYLQASDGKAYAGAGSVVLDSGGLKIYGSDVATFYYSTFPRGYIFTPSSYFVFQGNNCGFSIEADDASWIGTNSGDIELSPDGLDVFPASTDTDLGTATYYFDDVNYSDLIDRTPSPHFIKDAVSKIKALKTHTTTKNKKGYSPVQIETFTRESMPIDLIVPVTQRDKDKAEKTFQNHLKRRQYQLDRKKELEGKLKSLKGTEKVDAQRRIATIDKVIEKNPQIEKLEPQGGVSMNATTGLLLSAIKELTDRVEGLEAKYGG